MDHLLAAPVFIKYIRSLEIPLKDIVMVSPDEGRIKMTLHFQKKLGGAGLGPANSDYVSSLGTDAFAKAAGSGQQIEVHLLNVDGDDAGRLGRIDEEEQIVEMKRKIK